MLRVPRAVGRSENPGVPVLYGGHNLPPLVEIRLTDLPKFGGGTPDTPRDDRPVYLTIIVRSYAMPEPARERPPAA